MYKKYFKQPLDFILAFACIILISPFVLIITLILTIANNGKPLFFQVRPGKNEKKINIIKFKTMMDKFDLKGNLLPDAERLTSIGSFIRKLSLDEIPQLFNVIKGDMSFIGPRPLLMEYLPLYTEVQKKRHNVKPGITGWAQVNGRNAISWEEKFKLDIWYVDNYSFLLDIKILFFTVAKVFKSEGISDYGHATKELFKGKN